MKKIIFLITLLAPLMANSTKPCSPESYGANSVRSLSEWRDNSTWMAEFKVFNVKENWTPYPNCSMKDKSQCAVQNTGSFETKFLRTIKGKITKDTKLTAEYCAKSIPTKPGNYIFFGNKIGTYKGYDKNHPCCYGNPDPKFRCEIKKVMCL
jgi:hypothetical protein